MYSLKELSEAREVVMIQHSARGVDVGWEQTYNNGIDFLNMLLLKHDYPLKIVPNLVSPLHIREILGMVEDEYITELQVPELQ